MNTIYLHIGWPKTGTSFIQHILYKKSNLSNLRSMGILPLGGFFERAAPKEIAQIQSNSSASIRKCFDDQCKSLQWKNESIVISQEAYITLRMDEILKLREAFHDYTVKIILYLRSQDEIVEASWKQWHIHRFTFDEWVNQYISAPYSYSDRIADWVSVFGFDSIKIRNYNALPKGISSLASDFFNLFGIDHKTLIKPENRVNTRLDRESLEIIHLSRELLSSAHDNSLNDLFGKFQNKLSDTVGYQLLNEAQRLTIWNLHEMENIKLNKLYFDKDGPLFDFSKNVNEEAYQGLNKDNAIKRLVSIILEQEVKITSLRGEKKSLEDSIRRTLISRIKNRLLRSKI